MTSEGEVKPGKHFALSASVDPDEINRLLEENLNSLQKVVLATGKIPPHSASSSFADSGSTIHFFKGHEVFTSYKELQKVIG